MKSSNSSFGCLKALAAVSILALAITAPSARALSGQAAISSSNATIAYGTPFTPSYSGGSGTGGWQFCVAGYTGWDGAASSNTGTSVSGNGAGPWEASWTASAPGTYAIYVIRDGDSNYYASSAAGPYTLTVIKANQASVGSSNATIAYGTAFTPSYSGGSGTGGWQFCVASYTGWDGGASSNTGTSVSGNGSGPWESSWTPSATGTYSVYVVRDGDGDYNTSSIVGPYTLTVVLQNQAAVSSANATISFNGSTQSYPAFTPSYSGGSGTGGWQFCIAGYTGWDGGTSSNTGTSSGSGGSGTWSSSWTPSTPGTYSFYIVRDGDSYYNTSGMAGPYTLTVIGPVNGIQWNGVNMPATGVAGQTIMFYPNVTNTGTSYWSNYCIEVQDQYGNPITYPSISGLYPGQSFSPTVFLTLPSSPGTYSYTFTALQPSVQLFGSAQTATITVYPPAPVITSSASASGAVGTAFSYQITATNSPTVFYMTGSLPSGLSINSATGLISGTPTAAGTVSTGFDADNSGGVGYSALTITINPGTQASVSISPSSSSITYGQSVTLTASGGTGTGAYTWSGTGSGAGTTFTATPGGAGTSTVYMYKAADANYNQSATVAATITVAQAYQATTYSQNATINFNWSTLSYPAFTPSYSGGSGTGGWQFCIAGYTGWNAGTSSNTGTSSGTGGSGTWSSSWTPSTPGTYSVYVVRDGDSNYFSSSVSQPSFTQYTLTVNSPLNVTNGSATWTGGGNFSLASSPTSQGYMFNGWTVVSGSGTFANSQLSSTTFTAGAQASAPTVTANYVLVGTQIDPNTGITYELEIAAGMLNPNDPYNIRSTASQTNYQTYQYDQNNQVISGPDGNFNPDKEGNNSP